MAHQTQPPAQFNFVDHSLHNSGYLLCCYQGMRGPGPQGELQAQCLWIFRPVYKEARWSLLTTEHFFWDKNLSALQIQGPSPGPQVDTPPRLALAAGNSRHMVSEIRYSSTFLSLLRTLWLLRAAHIHIFKTAPVILIYALQMTPTRVKVKNRILLNSVHEGLKFPLRLGNEERRL